MKNFKKALALFTALATVSMSTVAFADKTATCTFEDANVTADCAATISDLEFDVTVDMAGATEDSESSFVLMDQDADVADVDVDDIVYLDQKTLTSSDSTFTGVINLDRITGADSDIPEGEYPVRVGYYDANGDFAIANAMLVISEDEPGTEKVGIIWADVNLDEEVDVNDAGDILSFLIGGASEYGDFVMGEDIGNGIIWADVNLDEEVDVNDAGDILSFLIGGASEYGDFVMGEEAELEIPATVE